MLFPLTSRCYDSSPLSPFFRFRTFFLFIVFQKNSIPMSFISILLAFLLGAGAILFFQNNTKKAEKKKEPVVNMPSVEEQERRLAEFRSSPFEDIKGVKSNLDLDEFKGLYEVVQREGVYATVKGGNLTKESKCLDFGTYDYHSFSTEKEVVEVARKTVMAYGVGSCGPRTFYGTVKPHVDCEKKLSTFTGAEDTAVYSFSYATISTLISCFASRGDYLVYDKGICSPVMEGCRLCRANMVEFKHNDIQDLEEKIKSVVAKDGYKKPHRRFVVTEGVFKNFGDICNLSEILRLCKQYKFRLIMDDSYGFGVVGKTGRGTPEVFGVPIKDIDVYVGSMSTSLGCVGGFCSGERGMVDFQRLAAAAYIFSASLPPYVTAACTEAVKLLEKNPSYCERIHTNTKKARALLRASKFNRNKLELVECKDDLSPIIILRATEAYVKEKNATDVEKQIQTVLNNCALKGALFTKHHYTNEEPTENIPSLRVVMKSQMTEEEVKTGMEVFIKAVEEVFA
ncbi:serine palmitoyltransferase-like protein [Angomonas deanei]|nr:serine palmitoyltransferase-like protein [Angomonas deanei]|eukprot:EPY43122.1 serine palmitoyltransferase-like protein [Angomonas deanei]